jgi:hypothetical protein
VLFLLVVAKEIRVIWEPLERKQSASQKNSNSPIAIEKVKFGNNASTNMFIAPRSLFSNGIANSYRRHDITDRKLSAAMNTESNPKDSGVYRRVNNGGAIIATI